MTSVGVRASFANDVARRESDIENAIALAERGVSSVRLRISWANIVPKEDRPAERTVEELAEMVSRLSRAVSLRNASAMPRGGAGCSAVLGASSGIRSSWPL